MRTKKEQSFHIEAPKLFNVMPKVVREETDMPRMKAMMDMWMEEVSDQPGIQGFTPGAFTSSGESSNSLRDWARGMIGVDDWTPPRPLPLPWPQRRERERLMSAAVQYLHLARGLGCT